MKKLAIGCGIVVLVLGAGAVVGSYVLYNKAKSYLGNFEALTSFQKFADSVENRTPFTPPASDELTADRMKRYAAVQDAMWVKMGPRFDRVAAMLKAEGRAPESAGLPELDRLWEAVKREGRKV